MITFDFKITNRVRLLTLLLVFVLVASIQLPKGYVLGQASPVSAISAPGAYTFSAVGVGSGVSLIGTAVQFHTLYGYTASTITACTYLLEGSTVSTFATTAQIGSTVTCNTLGAPTQMLTAQAKYNYVRVHVLTYTGTGNITLVYRGYNQDPTQTLTANQAGVVNITSAGTSVVVAAGTGAVHVYSVNLSLASTQTIQFYQGTSSCTSGVTALTGVVSGGTVAGAITPVNWGNGGAVLFSTGLAKDLCIATTTTGAVGGVVTYRQNN